VTDKRIYLSAPEVRSAERRFLEKAIDSNWIAPTGPDLTAFEEEIAVATGRSHAVAVTNGTAALHLALLVAGVGPGDVVLGSTLTFIGSTSPVVYCGAEPVFLDSEPTTWNLCPQLLADELKARAARNELPRAVICVDLYGASAEYDEIVGVLERYDVPLIEDAAEALGATYRGAPCGSFGDAAIVSFNGNKIVTSSGGGAYLTNDAEAAARARHLAANARESTVHYEHNEIGFNYGMSNLLAAFGRGQLQDLHERIERRRSIRNRYLAVTHGNADITVNTLPDHHRSNCWLTCIELSSESPHTPEGIRSRLEAENIESRPIWKPMHQQPVFRGAQARLNGVSDRLFANGLCLPSGTGMTDAEIERVTTALGQAIRS